MKKSIWIAIMLCGMVSMLSAQENNRLKPAQGNFTLEVGFNPVGMNPVMGMGLKGRYLITDRWFLRLNIPFDGSVTKNKFDVQLPDHTATTKSNFVSYGLLPGFEYHFTNVRRLSPYVGAELGFIHNIFSYKRTDYLNNNVSNEYLMKNMDNQNNRSNISARINILAGFDVYISKHLYLGVELGLGFGMNSTLKAKEITRPANGAEVEVKHDDKAVSTNFTIATQNLIRLGWAF